MVIIDTYNVENETVEECDATGRIAKCDNIAATYSNVLLDSIFLYSPLELYTYNC